MTERVATTTGLLPLPDPAKSELSDLKGYQKHDLISGTEGEEIASAYAEYRREVIDEQQSAGLDRVTEGQLRWDDMLAHPLTTHDNVDPNGIVRYYDNNNFYRDPQVRGELDFSGDVADELDTAAKLVDDPADSLQAVLPGPYSLFDLASDEHYGDDSEFFGAIADSSPAKSRRSRITRRSRCTSPRWSRTRRTRIASSDSPTPSTPSQARPTPMWSSTPTSARSTRQPTHT